jgi:hypothetical protein
MTFDSEVSIETTAEVTEGANEVVTKVCVPASVTMIAKTKELKKRLLKILEPYLCCVVLCCVVVIVYDAVLC